MTPTPWSATWCDAVLDGEGALANLVQADPRLGEDAAQLLASGVPVTRRTTPGGAGPDSVAAQIESFRARLDAATARFD